jgi:hypothetical protein
MKTIILLALTLQLSAVALAQTVSSSVPPTAPQIADVRSGELHLKGYFWKPAGPGPFPAILFNRASPVGDFPNYLDPPEGISSLGPVVIENPAIHNIYVDGSWNNDNPAALSKENIDAATQGIVDSDYFSAASQYGVSPPSFSGSDEKGGDFPCGPLPITAGVTSAAMISTWLACELAQAAPEGPTLGGFDAPDDNALYMVYLPKGTTFAEHSCSGIHLWAITTTIDFVFPVFVPAPQTVAFAVIPADCAASQANPLDAISKAASHEMIEAATDRIVPGPLVPFSLGWIDRSQSPVDQLSTGEAADLCAQGGRQPTPPVRLINGILVATYWSNADQTCVPLGFAIGLDESGLPATVPHTATLNGKTVTLPFKDNLEVGSAVSFSYPNPVSDPNPAIRYVTSDPGQTLTISAPVSDVAVYTRQFFLTTSTAPSFLAGIDPSLTPSGWHDDGQVISLDTSTPIETGPGTRYRFDHWSGDVSALTTHTSVTMTSPKTTIANYVLQFLLTVQTNGLGTNLTHIFNSSGELGTANDTNPLVVWIDAVKTGTLTADANVNGAGGAQYFFQGFVPPPPTALTSPFTTTAVYKTMAQLIDDGLSSGGISGPGAQGVANALKQKFAAIQHDLGVPHYGPALGDLKAFINQVDAQCCVPSPGKKITSVLAKTLKLDALLVYHNALCTAAAIHEISPTQAADDYSYYSSLVSSLGGTVLPPC